MSLYVIDDWGTSSLWFVCVCPSVCTLYICDCVSLAVPVLHDRNYMCFKLHCFYYPLPINDIMNKQNLCFTLPSLKLVHTSFNNRVLGTNTAAIFLQMIILSMHILPQIDVLLDFICMAPVDLSGVWWLICAISSFRYGAFVMSPRNNEKTKWHKSATIQESIESDKIQNEKFIHSRTRTHNLEISSLMLYRMSYVGMS